MKLLILALACSAFAFWPTSNPCTGQFQCIAQMWPDYDPAHEQGVCASKCTNDAECAAGYYCKSDNTCTAEPTGCGNFGFDKTNADAWVCYTTCTADVTGDQNCKTGYYCSAADTCTAYPSTCGAYGIDATARPFTCKTACTDAMSQYDCAAGYGCNGATPGVCTAIATTCGAWLPVVVGADVGKCYGVGTNDVTCAAASFAGCCVNDMYTTGQNWWDATNSECKTATCGAYKVNTDGTCKTQCTWATAKGLMSPDCVINMADPANSYGCKEDNTCAMGSPCTGTAPTANFGCQFDATGPWYTTVPFWSTCVADGTEDDHCAQGFYCSATNTCTAGTKCGWKAPPPAPPGSGAAAIGASVLAVVAAIMAAL